MYILYTTSGILVADSATLISNSLMKIGISWTSGETTAIGIEYANGVAKSYDAYSNVKDLKDLNDQIVLSQYEQSAKTATGIAVGAIAAEVITGAIAAGVGGAAVLTAAPIIIIGGGIATGFAAEEFWQGISDMTKYLLDTDAANAYENSAKSLQELIPGDANNNGIPDIHESTISQDVATSFTTSQRWVSIIRRDPLTFDLDNDGLETVGIDPNNPILFDHDGDGIKSGTGWVKSDDAFLVLDKNSNGTIDNGRELFGDSTIKNNGQLAVDGFDALADLDSNADGMVNASDTQFAYLKLWRDLNQDGISQTGELFTLNALGIASINVAKQINSQVLPDGNRIADLGTYTRVDGTLGGLGETSKLGDIDLAEDTFHRTFSDVLDTVAVANLPDMQGSGQLWDLRDAVNDKEWSVVA